MKANVIASSAFEGHLVVTDYRDGRAVAECSCGWTDQSIVYNRESYSARHVHEGALSDRVSKHLLSHLPDGEPF